MADCINIDCMRQAMYGDNVCSKCDEVSSTPADTKPRITCRFPGCNMPAPYEGSACSEANHARAATPARTPEEERAVIDESRRIFDPRIMAAPVVEPDTCLRCQGCGYDSPHGPSECSACYGTGVVPVVEPEQPTFSTPDPDDDRLAEVQVEALDWGPDVGAERMEDEPEQPTCAGCGERAKGHATINGERYCHEGASPTCYERASRSASEKKPNATGRDLDAPPYMGRMLATGVCRKGEHGKCGEPRGCQCPCHDAERYTTSREWVRDPDNPDTLTLQDTTTNCPRHGGTSTGSCVICNALPDSTTDQPYTDEQADELAANMAALRDTTTSPTTDFDEWADGFHVHGSEREDHRRTWEEARLTERARNKRIIEAKLSEWAGSSEARRGARAFAGDLLAAIEGGDDA